MEREQALALVKKQLKEERYIHTLGVVDTAIKLAGRYQVNRDQAELAAIFHDYAKNRPKEEMRAIIIKEQMPETLLQFHHELWHAPVGAYLVKTEAGIKDEAVLDAIRSHTTGRPGMTDLEKIVFLADYIEPGRSFPGVEEARKLAEENLDRAVLFALKNTIQFLMNKRQPIYPDTFHTYNYFLLK
ncbi:MAG TPA: bis(5'-nucleosyl)-tetraphosphatase (symmetrical) YqeK [Bacillus sp. (in: firmicutes)]|uniref:bis(5'-nucleosyl)-tetraphosphatase (symmetrical) YqeK n=1 Tax=Bacillus litorisediminis TaxID=2922713 RepID=UPI001FAC40E1|nr:bis(5'-nucleosyl)-tetraphosphatase (symmetrical) YqeK [Bacillus litorisediminis]HWO78768.1 bis(5'-nucleosyl)-tetraphosphatase (symmetrical) YqeK [Bacillus sp. (in: firmicutes)]